MSEKLIIKNFGPIKDIELDLRRVNVFIGDQGTGKSTVAKLISVIRQVVFLEIFDQDGNDLKTKNKEEAFVEYLKWYGISDYLKKDSFIDFTSSIFNFSYSNSIITKIDITVLGIERLKYSALVANDLFIPTERIYLSSLADAVYSLQEVDAEMPKVYLRYGNWFTRARKKLQLFDMSEVLNVKYKYQNDNDIILINDTDEILLKHASSALQGIIPMLIVLQDHLKISNNNDPKFLTLNVIEEPELNLFPTTQKSLVYKLISNNYHHQSVQKIIEDQSPSDIENEKEFINQILFTTHSPYILTSLNNLMYAYTVGQEHKAEVNEIISEKYWLNPNDVSAYLLIYDKEQGGCIAKNIIDEETHLIDSIQIDGVSDVLSEEFNQIMAIKLGV